jgi:ubiquinol-cytochrome c reductase iron-sulfur subunit
MPSASAKAAGAPIEVEIGKIEPRQLITVVARQSVLGTNRTKPMLDSLPKLDSKLADPNSNVPQQPAYCKNEHCSIKDAMWIAIGICTHLGCSPTTVGNRPRLGPDWLGGFFCRAINRSSTSPDALQGFAPTNLVIRRTSICRTRRS